MLKALHTKNLSSWMVFTILFLATKGMYYINIPGALGFEDYPTMIHISTASLQDNIAFVLALVAQFFICIWINYLVNKMNIIDNYSVIPAAISAVFFSLVFGAFRFNIHYITIFLMLAIIHLIQDISNENKHTLHTMYIGILQSIIILIFPISAATIPFLHLAIYTSKKQGVKSYVLLYLGLAIPIYFFNVWLYVLGFDWIDLKSILSSIKYFDGYIGMLDKIVWIVVTILLFVALFFVNSILNKLTFGRRQNVRAILIYGIFAIIPLLFFKSNDSTIFISFAPIYAIVLSVFTLRLKKYLYTELTFAAIVLGIIILGFSRVL